jgi:UDP-N-acetylglucosamine acyltransferase
VAVHQFCRIGAYAMLGGLSGVTQDIPPYVMANGQRAEISGLNLVGLRRNGFDQQQRSAIKQAYKILYKSGLKRAEALAKLRQEQVSAETAAIIAFAEKSERGLTSHR